MFSKFSALILLRLLTPVKLQIQLVSGLGATIILWGLTGLLAAAFQCRVPRVWETMSNQCFHTVFSGSYSFKIIDILTPIQITFWRCFGVLNIVTECILVMLPMLIIWNVQMPLGRKAVIVWCFAVRIS